MIGCQQKMADDDRDADREKDDEIAEQHLAKERRPIEREESADAADGKCRHQADGKGETDSNHTQAVVDGRQREHVEAVADPRRRLAEQPFEAKAEGDENGEQQQNLEPPTLTKFRGHEPGRTLELAGQIGEHDRQRNDMLADRTDMRGEIVRDRDLRRGMCRWRRRLG